MHPLIPAGSDILIDKTDKTLKDGKIYVFQVGNNVLVKKIIVGFDGYTAKSINHEYPDMKINDTHDLNIIGRAVMSLPFKKL